MWRTDVGSPRGEQRGLRPCLGFAPAEAWEPAPSLFARSGGREAQVLKKEEEECSRRVQTSVCNLGCQFSVRGSLRTSSPWRLLASYGCSVSSGFLGSFSLEI